MLGCLALLPDVCLSAQGAKKTLDRSPRTSVDYYYVRPALTGAVPSRTPGQGPTHRVPLAAHPAAPSSHLAVQAQAGRGGR